MIRNDNKHLLSKLTSLKLNLTMLARSWDAEHDRFHAESQEGRNIVYTLLNI